MKDLGKRKKISMRTVVVVIVLLLVIAAVGAYLFAGNVMTGERQTLSEALDWQSERYDTSFYTEASGEEKDAYTVNGYDGYELHAEILRCPEESDRYVIISHGYTDNRVGSLKYAKMYLALGFNCIIYDLRGHGENEETFTTYGILEGKDLDLLIKDTRERFPGITQLGLHGESLGAATTLSCLRYEPDVDFAVADCGFADIESVLKNGVKQIGLPAVIIDAANIGAKIRFGYALSDMRPIDALDENTIPVLFIHGADDEYIVPQNSQDMYERTKGKKEIHLVEGAGHAESMLNAPEEYQETVEAFLASL